MYVVYNVNCKKNNLESASDLEKYLKNALEPLELEYVTNNIMNDYDKVIECANNFTDEIIFTSLYKNNSDQSMKSNTPESVIKLASNLLKVKKEDKIIDIHSKNGNFIIDQKNENNDIESIYMTNSFDDYIKTKLKLSFFDQVEVSCYEGNFTYSNVKADKIFANRFSDEPSKDSEDIVEYLRLHHHELSMERRIRNSEWIYNLETIGQLNKNGKIVAVMPNGAMINASDKKNREYFIQNGWVESIVTLPQRIFNFTSQAMSLVVLSRGNNYINMIDASEMYVKNRRVNTISEDQIKLILEAMEAKSNISKKINYDEVIDNNYSFNTSEYLGNKITLKDSVEFKDVILSLARGISLYSDEMDEVVSQEETSTLYLENNNIVDNVIKWDEITYLKNRQEYIVKKVKDNSLLISKGGFPYKICVMDAPNEKDVVVSSNLYVVELDETKANPYFIKAYLLSEIGQELLRRKSVGSVLTMLSRESILKLKVPLPSIEVQNLFAKMYVTELKEIEKQKVNLDRRMQMLDHLVDDLIL